MKRFVFRLDGILRLREHEFEQHRRRWLVIENERRVRRRRLEDLADRLAKGHAMLAVEVARGSEARRLGLRARGLAVGRFQVAQAESNLSEIEKPCEAARQKMLAARVRVRSLEQLRDRQAEQHRLESIRREQNELDEMAGLRAVRATGEDPQWA